MNRIIKSVEVELWHISLLAILVFYLLVWMFSCLAEKSSLYARYGYLIALSVYIGFFKTKIHDTQGEPKSLLVLSAMIYMFVVACVFGNRYLIQGDRKS